MMSVEFLPSDFDLEEWKLFRKYNNREEKRSRHIDAWFFDQPGLTKEQWQERLEYNKEHLIKDLFDQIANGGLKDA